MGRMTVKRKINTIDGVGLCQLVRERFKTGAVLTDAMKSQPDYRP